MSDTSALQQKPPDTSAVQQESPDTSALQQEPPDASALQQEPPDTSAVQQEPLDTSAVQQEPPDTSAAQQEPPDTSAAQQEPPDTSCIILIPADSFLSSDQLVKSQSEPSVPKPDPIVLYTTAPDGLPPIFRLLLQLSMDVLTFLIRGGLSTLMFFMDLLLRVFIFTFETWLQFPGAFMVTYVARFTMWSYQVFIWVAYTMVELVFYLPTPLLVLYLLFLVLLYYKMPEELEFVLHSMVWVSEHFLGVAKYLALAGGAGWG